MPAFVLATAGDKSLNPPPPKRLEDAAEDGRFFQRVNSMERKGEMVWNCSGIKSIKPF